MISRKKAEDILENVRYEKHLAAADIAGIIHGTTMPIYYSPDIRKDYTYGTNGNIEGYIARSRKRSRIKNVKRLIGYHGNMILVDSRMRIVAR